MVGYCKVFCSAVLLLVLAISHSEGQAGCPCKNHTLCQPLSTKPYKEVLAFVVNKDNWPLYNYTRLTTLAMFTDLEPELLCHAHSLGVRVVLAADFAVKDLSDKTKWEPWIQQQLKKVQESFADGINIDIEDPTQNGTDQAQLLTQLVGQTYKAFKNANSNYKVSFDVAWSPNCIDGRCYEYTELATVTDYLVIMSYDERSQIYGPCVAGANSGYNTTATGILQYRALGLNTTKLILGVPWYGYNYPCLSVTEDHVCSIEKVPFRGVDCSDAAGKQIPYSEIRDLILQYNAIIRWDSFQLSPYFDHSTGGKDYQLESKEDTTVCADSDGGEDEVDGYVLSEKEIISAIRKDSLTDPVVQRLEQIGVDKYLDTEHNNYTALHFASHFNKPSIVRKLLKEMKADIKIKDKADNMSINIAACLGNDEVISVMIDHDSDCVMWKGQFSAIPLHNACRRGHFNVVKVLMEHCQVSEPLRRKQIKARTRDHLQTPLHLAALYGHVKIVSFLLEICSRLRIELVNLRSYFDGQTPVHTAAFRGKTEVIEVMVEKYPDCLQYRDTRNGTAFLTACGYGHTHLVEHLITEHNADYQGDSLGLDKSGDEPDSGMKRNDQVAQMPLIRASRYGRSMIVKLLLDKGVTPHPQALVEAIKGGYHETAKELLRCSRSGWPKLLRYTYVGEDGDETTPFRELIRHMPDVAEIVFNKCMKLEKSERGQYYITFDYDFVEDFEPNRDNNDERSTWERPKSFNKDNHPLLIIVNHKRHRLLSHPLIASLIHRKWKSFGWIRLLNWIFFITHLFLITTLALLLSHPNDNDCVNGTATLGNTTSETHERSPQSCGHSVKSVFMRILATEAVGYSLFNLMFRVMIVFLSLKHVYSLRDRKETNPLYQLRDVVGCVVNWTTMIVFPLFILSLIYALSVYPLDNCLCPFSWQLEVGAVVILLTWLELIVLSTQFQFIGVYILMLSRVLLTFLKTCVLLCLLIAGFGLVFYLSLNDPKVVGGSLITPGLSLLKVIEGTVGEEFNSFVPLDANSSTVNSYSALTLILWVLFIVVMPVLFTNLLIGLAVGDIQAIYEVANFEKKALQVNYILSVENQLHRIGIRPKKPRSKAYYEHSLCEMLVNKLIVVLWGGESFDSFESNQKLLEHHQAFWNSHRFTPDSKTATREDIDQLRYSIDQLRKES